MKEFLDKYKGIIFILTMLAAVYVYLYVTHKKIDKDGVYTVVRFDYYEGHADGGAYYFTIFFNNDSVQADMPVDPEADLRKGHYYFAKVRKDKPYKYFILYSKTEVPACILKEQIPQFGWQSIPDCKSTSE